MNPIPISSLEPSESEIKSARLDIRKRYAVDCEFGDVLEAIGERLDDIKQVVLLETIKRSYAAGANPDTVDHLVIAALVMEAFRLHVEKWAEREVSSYVDGYAVGKAEELREQGRTVDWAL